MTIQQAVGVCSFITPWNFPLAMIGRKVAAALAAGCPSVAKPSEDTPFSAVLLAQICHDAGVPDGVFNVVTGDRSQGVHIGTSSRLRRLASLSY